MSRFFSLSHKYRSMFVVLAALLCLLLSSCAYYDVDAEMDYTVYSGDRYQGVFVFSVDADIVTFAGGTKELERRLDELVAQAKADGIKLTWRRLETQQTNVIKYEFRTEIGEIKDEGYGRTGLKDVFVWREVSHNNRRAYKIEFTGITNWRSAGLRNLILTLHAGKILESNGDQVDASTVRWVNPRQTPYAIVIPKGDVEWIPLVGAGLLLAATGGIMLILVLTGKLKAWSATGFSASKWRVQAMKLSNDRTRVEKDKDKLLSELGVKAWEARVVHPSYAELYGQLETLEQQRTALNEQIRTLELQLQQVRQTRSQTDSEYATRISRLQEERKGATTRLTQVRADKTALEKRLSKAQTDQHKIQAELQSLHSRLAQVQSSAVPDRDTQAASLSNAIAALEQSLAQLVGDMLRSQSEIARLEAEQQLLADEVNRLEQQLAQVQTEQREALAPMDRQMTALQGEIRAYTEQLAALAQQMTPLINDLGPLVDRARPESSALSELYTRLDQCYQELTNISQQHNLLKARLGAADPGAVRNFYFTIGGSLIALILMVLLLVIALS